MNRYIEFFNGYRHAYGVADFEHPDAYIDSETGKKKPVYRWNFEELTNEIYQQHLEGKLSIGIQPCNEKNHARFGAIDIDPQEYVDFDRKFYLDKIKEYELPIIPILSKSGGLHLYVFTKDFIPAKNGVLIGGLIFLKDWIIRYLPFERSNAELRASSVGL